MSDREEKSKVLWFLVILLSFFSALISVSIFYMRDSPNQFQSEKITPEVISPAEPQQKISATNQIKIPEDTQLCPLQLGVCAGSHQTCANFNWPGCSAANYGPNYQVVETLCDGLDNDCDGTVDEGCTINCKTNADCGANGWIGSSSCSNDDVYQTYRTYTCSNSETYNAECSHSDALALKQDCETDSYSDWSAKYCYLNDVYHSKTFYNRGCNVGACFVANSTQVAIVQDCPYGCSNGQCNPYDLSLCMGSAECFIGRVQRVTDGDTLNISQTETFTFVTIRLALTNTPEWYESGGSDATQFTKNLCPEGSYVLVDQDDEQLEDIHGRMLAVVYCGDYNLNEQLLETHHGNISTDFCNKSEFGNENWAVKFGC